MRGLKCAGVGLLALVWTACVQDGVFECGDNGECVQGGIGGVCQIDGYCSFPDPACESDQRYGTLAPSDLAEACVPPGPDVIDTSGDLVTAGGDNGGDGGNDTEGVSATAGESADDSEGFFDTDDLSLSGGDASSGGGSDLGRCVDIDLGSGVGEVDVRTFSGQGDDFSPSCFGYDGRDVAYAWVAPLPGEYRFAALGGLYDIGILLYDACEGSELACNDDGAYPFSGIVHRNVEQGEAVLIVVDASPADHTDFRLQITMVPE